MEVQDPAIREEMRTIVYELVRRGEPL